MLLLTRWLCVCVCVCACLFLVCFCQVGGKSGIAGKADKLKESIRRHYHNAFTDVNKQDAINIFLGR